MALWVLYSSGSLLTQHFSSRRIDNMTKGRERIVNSCLECGEAVPYQGKGRPRTRHVRCMTPKQRTDRAYMKSYMPKYYERPGNREKHNKRCIEYLKKKGLGYESLDD